MTGIAILHLRLPAMALCEGTETKKNELFDPFEHKLVLKLLPEYLQVIENCRVDIFRLEGEKGAFEQQSEDEAEEVQEEGEDETKPNYAKALEEEKNVLKEQARNSLVRIKFLERGSGVKDMGSIAAMKKLGKNTTVLECELTLLKQEVAPIQQLIDKIDEALAPYIKIKKQLTEAKKQLKALSNALLKVLKKKRADLSSDECRALVLDLSREDLELVLIRYVEEHRQEVRTAIENLWNKYGVSLQVIRSERNTAIERLDEYLKELKYA
jgi:type I restriction enzyme M protein